ncbi:DEP domain-containing protein 7-like isoform X3 [Ptychodera flava]|uniref:DEP domain-containing protein 7-like isoform X3 n=1 Tax=Ptychodera flava TaxID=63121 RepID=UPI00396A740B
MESHVFECVSCSHGQTKKSTFEDSSSHFYRFCDNNNSPVTPPKEKTPKIKRRRRSSFGITRQKQIARASPKTPDAERVISNPNPFSPYGELFHRILHGSERNNSASVRTDTPQPSPKPVAKSLSPADISHIWSDVALERLLHIVDLSFLDHVLQFTSTNTKQKPDDIHNVVISNAFARADSPFMTRNSQSGSDPWIVAALNCLDQHPESLRIVASLLDDNGSLENDDSEETEFIKKSALFKAVVDCYQGRKDPLLPKEFFELYIAIQELLANDKCERALEAVKLHMLMLSSTTRNSLKRLLDFMAIAASPYSVELDRKVDNRTLVRRTFTSAILHHPTLTKGQAEQVVVFMMDKNYEVFLLPSGITIDVDDRIKCEQQGREIQARETYCEKITKMEFEEQKMSLTNQALQELMNVVIDDLTLTLKEKKQKLKLLNKHHPEVYSRHFAEML